MIKKIVLIVFTLLIIGVVLGINKVFLGNLQTVRIPIESTKNGKTVVDMGKVSEEMMNKMTDVKKITNSKEVSNIMNIINSNKPIKETKDSKDSKKYTNYIEVDKAIGVIKSINWIDAKFEVKNNELIIKYKQSDKGVLTW